MKRIAPAIYLKLGLLGALTSFRIAEKIEGMFDWPITTTVLMRNRSKPFHYGSSAELASKNLAVKEKTVTDIKQNDF